MSWLLCKTFKEDFPLWNSTLYIAVVCGANSFVSNTNLGNMPASCNTLICFSRTSILNTPEQSGFTLTCKNVPTPTRKEVMQESHQEWLEWFTLLTTLVYYCVTFQLWNEILLLKITFWAVAVQAVSWLGKCFSWGETFTRAPLHELLNILLISWSIYVLPIYSLQYTGIKNIKETCNHGHSNVNCKPFSFTAITV